MRVLGQELEVKVLAVLLMHRFRVDLLAGQSFRRQVIPTISPREGGQGATARENKEAEGGFWQGRRKVRGEEGDNKGGDGR